MATSSMKILLIHNYYQQRGGEDSVFESEAALLRQHGEQVETLTFHNDQIKTPMDKFLVGLTATYNAGSAHRLKAVIRTFQPDVIHVHNFFPLASPAVLMEARRAGIPVVMTIHNFRLVCPNALLYRQGRVCEECVSQYVPISGVLHGCYRGSRLQSAMLTLMMTTHKVCGTWQGMDRYICLNRFVRDKLLSSSLHLSPDSLVIKPNFVFDPHPELLTVLNPAERDESFLFVGRLSEEKGINTLIDAFQDARFKLKVIGTGPEESRIRDLARQNPGVEYLGFRDREFILNAMSRCRALLVPSIWYENFPMTILEAFSTGTPVITSRIGGLPEIVEEGRTGLLAEPGSVDSLREQLVRMQAIADHPDMCRRVRETYLEHYAPDRNYERLMDIYNSVLGNVSDGSRAPVVTPDLPPVRP